MSLTIDEQAAAARAELYNHNQYDVITNPYGFGGIGYKTPAANGLQGNWAQALADAAVLAEAAAREATDSTASAAAAAISAAIAASYLRYTASSSTVTIGTGTKTFVVDEDRQFSTNDNVQAIDTSDDNNWLFGRVLSYDIATNILELDIDSGNTSGSGSISEWSILISGPRGPEGAPGDGVPAIDGSDADDGKILYVDGSAAALGTAATLNLGRVNAENTWSLAQTFTGGVIGHRPTFTDADDHTFVLGDANKYGRYTGAGTHTWTLPANASVAFVVGTEIEVFNAGAGELTLEAASGVNVNGVTAGSVVIPSYGAAVLKKTATNSWDYIGPDAAAWAV